ncbi:TetR/AcrR family transcriptional regulator [Paraburkholderia ferrariae]|uniref:TetR/AcrR family transcriptional regulator n=1 Tax=Paraburkholderia ferrariae TaxID=386056 RepID=UPI0012EB38D7|nr:TetR/AcrR family transcriptional regulator [Paraburkholderia ferrariae]
MTHTITTRSTLDGLMTIGNIKERPNSDGRREQIISAALSVMVAEGLHQTTTRKIAAAANVNVATLHYHFQDKEEILLRVLEKLVSDYRTTMENQIPRTQSLHDRLRDVLYFVWGEIKKAPAEQLLLQEMTIYVLRDPRTESLAREKDRVFLSLYVDALMGASDTGPEERPFIVALANFIYTSIIGIFNQWLATKDEPCLMLTLANLVSAAQLAARERAWPPLAYAGGV